ncbi:MAG TPA: hypothetical protein VJX66_18180 [Amycolatopsis sp.]|nr:hypothetical protein [Amycolatopsis sp.]
MKDELIRMIMAKASGGKMNGKALIGLVVVGLLVLAGFIAYRLVLVELITHLSRR